MLRIFEQNVVRKIYGPVREEESVEIRKKKEIMGILQSTGIVEFINPLRLRQNGHVERMQRLRMPQKNCDGYTGRNKEKRKTT